jgi:hypothetical protein
MAIPRIVVAGFADPVALAVVISEQPLARWELLKILPNASIVSGASRPPAGASPARPIGREVIAGSAGKAGETPH